MHRLKKWLSRFMTEKKPERTKEEKLFNAPIFIKVGGCNPNNARRTKTIEIREPNIKTFQKHMELIIGSIHEIAITNTLWLEKLFENPNTFNIRKDLAKSKPVIEAITELVCDLVKENQDYVENDMSARQINDVIYSYIQVVGLEQIWNVFTQTLTDWKALMERKAEVVSLGSSQT